MLLAPWAIALLLAASSTLAGALSEHSIVEKSIVQAQQECVEYLNIPHHRLYEYLGHNYANDAKTKCMIRCVGLNLKWWNGGVVLREDVIRQYFAPDPEDRSSIDRTRACIDKRVNSKSTLCSRAFEIFQCYREHYGQLLNCPRTVPLGEERFAEAIHYCLDTLQATLAEFRTYCSSRGFLDCERSRCLLRCIAIRTGIYSDQYGAFAMRYQLQFGNSTSGSGGDGLEQDICTTRLRREGLDKCTLAARVLHECFDFPITLHTALERSLILLSPLMEIPTPVTTTATTIQPTTEVNKKPRSYNSRITISDLDEDAQDQDQDQDEDKDEH
ncbi:general odorant-binding protein 45-like [Anopheles darlingi]|uniref:general odorant-binding protein 45-like n=1 Tax=Anopheles darlingi TaxID=43151 RepID=UPI00210009C9|nr:general odorant-binding protein 45-like [Anopheles darlingi]